LLYYNKEVNVLLYIFFKYNKLGFEFNQLYHKLCLKT